MHAVWDQTVKSPKHNMKQLIKLWDDCHMTTFRSKFWRKHIGLGQWKVCMFSPLALWTVQKCWAFRHFCIILDEHLDVNNCQMPSIPVGSYVRMLIFTGNSNMSQQLALLTTWFVEMRFASHPEVVCVSVEFKASVPWHWCYLFL